VILFRIRIEGAFRFPRLQESIVFQGIFGGQRQKFRTRNADLFGRRIDCIQKKRLKRDRDLDFVSLGAGPCDPNMFLGALSSFFSWVFFGRYLGILWKILGYSLEDVEERLISRNYTIKGRKT
jgi:hypothetical protein